MQKYNFFLRTIQNKTWKRDIYLRQDLNGRISALTDKINVKIAKQNITARIMVVCFSEAGIKLTE